MSLKVHLNECLLNLFSAKLRSLLAILGIVIGTAAIVALMASSRLAMDYSLAQFKSLGTNLLAIDIDHVSSSNRIVGKANLTLNQTLQLATVSPQIVMAVPYTNFSQKVTLYKKSKSTIVLGTTPHFKEIAKLHLTRGRFISTVDGNTFYCVIGSTLAEQLKQHHIDPIGKQITVGNKIFTIIGVLAKWRSNLFLFSDINKSIIISLRSAALMISPLELNSILFQLIKGSNADQVQQRLVTVLKRLLPDKRLRFVSPQRVIRVLRDERKTFNNLLIAIGSIALIVGAIGVMNIMLVSVIERRREIGIRLAVGAQRYHILMMFLTESVMLTLLGGLLGIAVGFGTTYVLANLAGWHFSFYVAPLTLGFFVSFLVGVIAGLYPAWRASKLDPILCLML